MVCPSSAPRWATAISRKMSPAIWSNSEAEPALFDRSGPCSARRARSMVGAAFRPAFFGLRFFLIGHALAGMGAGLVGLLIARAFLFVTVADTANGLAHSCLPPSWMNL